MAALGEYLRVYYFNNPDSTYYDLERMYKSGNIVFLTAEGWINNQLSRYEGQLQQWGWTWH